MVDVWKWQGPGIRSPGASAAPRRISGLGDGKRERWAGRDGRYVWWLGVGFRGLSTAPLVYDEVSRQTGRAARRGREDVSASPYHEPAMVEEVLKHLVPERGGTFLDGTVGGGGHGEAILSAGSEARLLGVDRDPDALAAARRRLARFGDRVQLEVGDYADARTIYDLGEGTLAGVLLDLGVSSRQIDFTDRGFSFRPGTPLDMRMSQERSIETAADLLNDLPQDELTEIFRTYGEERRAGRLAAEIVRRRREAPFAVSDDLIAAMDAALPQPITASDRARIFQALRIAVNDELESLDRALPTLRDLLAPEGRIVVISYHSLEDRRVKRAFRDWSKECICPPDLPVCRCRGRALGRVLTRRPIRPGEKELSRNPRARSARLRAWERGE